MDTEEKCSCGARYKYKCQEEGGYKMCARELVEGISIIEAWNKKFIEKQEHLPLEFQKIILDNLSSLYEE